MRIEGNGLFGLFTSLDKKKIQENKNEVEIKETKETKDVYNFKYDAKEIKEYQELALGSQNIREDKVEELKNKLENGEYFVSGKDVVSKILGDK